MAANAAAAGALALTNKQFANAIGHYTRALTESPTSPDYHIQRSIAYQRSSPPQHELALRDAESGVYYAHQRGKREQIIRAQMRRGISLYALGRYADAKKCFDWVRERGGDDRLDMWDQKVDLQIKRADTSAEGTAATVVEIPQPNEAQEMSDGGKNMDRVTGGSRVEVVPTPSEKIRHEWYQTAQAVVVSVLAKNVPGNQVTVETHERSLSVSFPTSNGSAYDLSLDPLFGAIDPEKSTCTTTSTRVEIRLWKAKPGQKWASLESTEPVPKHDDTPDRPRSPSDVNPQPAVLSRPAAPAYPTSSRTGPKNWDQLASDLIKKSKTNTPSSTTSPSGPTAGDAADDDNDNNDDDDDLDTTDPVNAFFKKLYAGADADTRRAMMKSYQESNGTALSTNWAEVAKAKVEVTPPDGMEAKKWGE